MIDKEVETRVPCPPEYDLFARNDEMSDLERVSFPPRRLPEGTTRKVLNNPAYPVILSKYLLDVF